MPKYFINYGQNGGLNSEIIIKTLNDNHDLIWGYFLVICQNSLHMLKYLILIGVSKELNI